MYNFRTDLALERRDIYKKVNKKKIFENKNQYIKYIAIPTAFYTLLVSLSAPWIEL